MEFPVSGVGHFVDSLVMIFFYYRMRKNRVKDNKFFLFFEKFTLSMSLFFLVISLPNLFFPSSSFLLGLGYVLGHIFLYISYAYLAKISLLIFRPKYDSKNIFWSYLFFGSVITVLNVYYFNHPVLAENGITQFNVEPLVGFLIVLFSLLSFLPASVLFLRESIRRPEQRMRYALIGISFLVVLLGGPLHDIARNTSTYLVADAITTLGFILMLISVLSKSKESTQK